MIQFTILQGPSSVKIHSGALKIHLINLDCRYSDNEYEYRHVQLPKAMLKAIPKDYHDPSKGTLKLLWEEEWRAIGITQVRAEL